MLPLLWLTLLCSLLSPRSCLLASSLSFSPLVASLTNEPTESIFFRFRSSLLVSNNWSCRSVAPTSRQAVAVDSTSFVFPKAIEEAAEFMRRKSDIESRRCCCCCCNWCSCCTTATTWWKFALLIVCVDKSLCSSPNLAVLEVGGLRLRVEARVNLSRLGLLLILFKSKWVQEVGGWIMDGDKNRLDRKSDICWVNLTNYAGMRLSMVNIFRITWAANLYCILNLSDF